MEKKIEIRNLKGTFDFLPDKQIVRNKIIDVLKKNFERYGYLPIETPILNEFDLLKYKYDENAEILKEIYRLSDQGKRDIGLRFDLTVPFCKFIALNKDLTMPFRRYEIGRVFRDGPVKAGRTREFYQCDVDIVGIDGRYIEIEQMQMVANIFKELQIDIVIKWNNRKLMFGLLQELGFEGKSIDEAVGLIDRIAKISKKELVEEFTKIGANEEKVEELLNLFNLELFEYKQKFENTQNQNIKEGLEEICEVYDYLQKLELLKVCKFSPTLARGLGIYTGTVFEFFDKQNRISSSLGGGGRYNKIITNFMDNGMEYPAVGLSFGLEPIYYILQNQAISNLVDVLIVPMDTQLECLSIADKLREIGANVVTELSNKKVKKAFDYANKLGIKYVMVVGEDEINSQKLSIKDMQKGEQYSFDMDSLLKFVKESLKK